MNNEQFRSKALNLQFVLQRKSYHLQWSSAALRAASTTSWGEGGMKKAIGKPILNTHFLHNKCKNVIQELVKTLPKHLPKAPLDTTLDPPGHPSPQNIDFELYLARLGGHYGALGATFGRLWGPLGAQVGTF